MSFDDRTRTLLANMVAACRDHLVEDVTDQLQSTYGLYPDGESLDVARTEQERRAAEDLRELLAYYAANAAGKPKQRKQSAYQRLVREIGFTALNRLAALRLCEERGLVIECVRRGMASDGFQLYDRIANGGLGNRYRTYRAFLEGIYDELALDLGVLFDRTTPHAHVFPSEAALTAVLDRLNDPELAQRRIWQQDETVGWIYQYYNDPAERKKMRSESRAPRNSRELAVRNQFFTPRYVVEFLTANTLGRLWYEMRRANTALPDRCRYFVRRPNEVFLEEGEEVPPSSSPRTQGEDSADEGLATPYYIPFRPPKDPRALKLLDPAVGSAHFLLYAFDLFTLIYEEAWADPDSAYFEETGRTLREDYPDLDDLRRAVPGLILRYNLHGIDIDPRAVQIANLALWLRAQRAYQEQGLSAAQRPAITKSNIVTAEPMPGDRVLLDEFVQDLQPPVLGDLVRVVFEEMELAGEAGSLLKIEEDLAGAIAEAKRQWQRLGREKQLALFAQPPAVEQGELFDLSGISDEAFWETAEERVLDVLREYAAETDMRHQMFAEDTAQGFAFIDLCRQIYDVALMNPPFGDASGAAQVYIDENYSNTTNDIFTTFVECFQDRLLPQGYLGIISSRAGLFLRNTADWREHVLLRLYRPLLLADLGEGVLDAMVEAAAYVLRTVSVEEDQNLTLQLLPELSEVKKDRSGYFSIPKYQEQRNLKRHQAKRELSRLLQGNFISYIDGRYARYEVNTSQVSAAKLPKHDFLPSLICLRLLIETDKDETLLSALHTSGDERRFIVSPKRFSMLDGAPFIYWVSRTSLKKLTDFPVLEGTAGTIRVGLQTGEDWRFLRMLWEIAADSITRESEWTGYAEISESITNQVHNGKRWIPFSKTDFAAPWFSPLLQVVLWEQEGEHLKNFRDTLGKLRSALRSPEMYFRPGFSYMLRSTRLVPYIVPSGVIPTAGRAQVYPDEGAEFSLLGYCASNVASAVARFSGEMFARPKFQASMVQNLPVTDFPANLIQRISEQIEEEVNKRRKSAQGHEPFQEFTRPVLLDKEERETSWDLLTLLGEDLEREIAQAFGLTPEQLAELERDVREAVAIRASPSEDEEDDEDDTSVEFVDESPVSQHEGLLSYCVGVAMGRWDVRMGQNAALAPALQGVFDPLPVCPPGMLVGPDGLPATPDNIVSEAWLRARPNAITLPPDGSFDGPATIPDEVYPLPIAWDGILVDDPGLGEHAEPHPSDIARRVRGALALLWPDTHAEIEAEACEILGVRDLRDYFSRPTKFFADHLARYSKSRRKAPIYWPLSTASGRYTLWLYYHRLTDQTLYTAVNRYVTPKIEAVQRHVAGMEARLRETSGAAATALRDDLDEQTSFLAELRAFRDDLLAAAALPYKPDLNDGVIINAAPLHKLFSLSRWRNDTEKIWEKLQAGEYNWAHMALVLWPERVKEVCRRDKSIAIAHGLEGLYEE